MSECSHLGLEKNFWNWLEQAKADFDAIIQLDDVHLISKKASDRFGLLLNESDLAKSLGASLSGAQHAPLKIQIIDEKNAPKPWTAKS